MKLKHCPQQIKLKALSLGTMSKFNAQNRYWFVETNQNISSTFSSKKIPRPPSANRTSVIDIEEKQSPRGVFKKSVLRNFGKLTEKHLCQSVFFNNVVAQGLQLYWKRDSSTGVFLWFLQISKNTFSYRRPPLADHYGTLCFKMLRFCTKCNSNILQWKRVHHVKEPLFSKF